MSSIMSHLYLLFFRRGEDQSRKTAFSFILGREKDLVYAGIDERQDFFVATQRQVETFSEACMSYSTPIAQIRII